MITIISILSFLLLFFAFFCIKFALVIIRMQDVIEDSLDKIDDKYNRISEILEIPLFFDSPEIRRLLGEIKEVKDIVLEISSNLSNNKFINEEEKEEENI